MTAADPAAVPPTSPPSAQPVAEKTPVHRRSRRAVARSAAGDRWLVGVVGAVLLLAGVGATLLSYGVLGTGRSQRPLLDPIIVDALRNQALLWRIVALVGGLLLIVFGLLWAARSVRPERRPDLELDSGPDTSLRVTAAAVAEAVAGEARAVPGVSRTRARLVGDDRYPALRLTVWLAEDADVAEVCRRIPDDVIGGARECLGVAELPTAVRIEYDTAGTRSRVQ